VQAALQWRDPRILFGQRATSQLGHSLPIRLVTASRDVRSTPNALRVPYPYARRTARQNKEDIRRHSERRWRDDSSVAMSQAGVNDLIAVKYSHRCAG
jgi:hypothetical protein